MRSTALPLPRASTSPRDVGAACLHPQPSPLSLSLSLTLTLGEAGPCPLASFQGGHQFGHAVQLRPLLGLDGRCCGSARPSSGPQHGTHALLTEPLHNGRAKRPQFTRDTLVRLRSSPCLRSWPLVRGRSSPG